MILMLQPDQVGAFWDAIKHGLIVANRPSNTQEQDYCNKVLEKCLNGKAQCWLSVTDREEGRVFNAFGITTIEETAFGEVYLFLHSLYAFRVIPNEDLQEIIPKLEQFGKVAGATRMITFTKIERLKALYTQWGFTQDLSLYAKEI